MPEANDTQWLRERAVALARQTTGGDTAAAAGLEKAVLAGDLARLSHEERLAYYTAVCRSLGLNPLTHPLGYLALSGRLVLYVKREATDQLRRRHQVTVDRVEAREVEGIWLAEVHGHTPDGREDTEIGAVPVVTAQGQPVSPAERANAAMKAVTKAKRRLTLSLIGLGWLGEDELDTLPEAAPWDDPADLPEAEKGGGAHDERGMGV